MRTVIQKVSKASVTVNGKIVADINNGLVVLLGVEDADNIDDVVWLSNKIAQLRIFNDSRGVMNRSVLEVDGEIIVVSQFTLHAKTKKGNRPSYIKASKPDHAVPMYVAFCEELSKAIGKEVQQGVFGEHMDVELINDGPVTIIIDTKNKE